jgi:hypothetical protein
MPLTGFDAESRWLWRGRNLLVSTNRAPSKNERASAAVHEKNRLVYTNYHFKAEAEMARELILLHSVKKLMYVDRRQVL